jgi:hypothetical protein
MFCKGAIMTVFDIAAYELQREELEERIQRLRGDLALTSGAIARAEADLYRLEGRISLLREHGGAAAGGRHKKRTKRAILPRVENPNRAIVADMALGLIREIGRPLPRSELFQALSSRGLRLEGKDPLMIFSTMLWRERARIIRLNGFGYWPTGEAFPPAGYTPGDEQPNLL